MGPASDDGRTRMAFSRNAVLAVEGAARSQLSDAEYRVICDNAPVRIHKIDADGRILHVNIGGAGLFGYFPEDLVGKRIGEAAGSDTRRELDLLHDLVTGKSDRYSLDRATSHKSGAPGWIQITCAAVRDNSGAFLYAVRVLTDATERHSRFDHQDLLLQELHHRIKNILSTVRSLAFQTMRSTQDPEVFFEKMERRLTGLAVTHEVLGRQNWLGGDLKQLIMAELAPLSESGAGQWHLSGPRVWLDPNQIVNLGMMVHELATNALKYGALSGPAGRLTVTWRVEADRVVLAWTERGGPPPAPGPSGFGTRLFAVLARSLEAQFDYDLATPGLQLALTFPLASSGLAVQD